MAALRSYPATKTYFVPAIESPSHHQPVHVHTGETNWSVGQEIVSQFYSIFLNLVTQLFKFFHKYRPESKAQKRERLRNLAKTKAKGGQLPAVKKIIAVKYGIHNITRLIEQKKAVLVAIAHDVDPIEVGNIINCSSLHLSL